MFEKTAKCTREDFYLPFYVRSIGYCTIPKGNPVTSAHIRNVFIELYWCLNGKGTVTLFDQELLLEAGDVFWYLPNEDHKIEAKTSELSYIYLTLSGPLANAILLSYHYPRLIKNAGPAPDEIFQEILEKVAEPHLSTARHLTSLAMQILEKIGGPEKPLFTRFQVAEHFVEIVTSSFSDPSLNINSIADMLGIHRTTLTRFVQKDLKRSPSEFLLSVRAQRGIDMLYGTDLPISEIAQSCGLPNVTYFDRVVRRCTGKSPTELRKLRKETPPD